MKRIVFACFGSLGDLHPYLAVGKALQARGHHAALCTTDRYRAAVEAEGLAWAPLRPSEAQMIGTQGELKAVMRRLFDPLRGPEYMVRELLMPHIRAQHADIAAACERADLLVTHPLALTGPLVCAQRGLPWVSSVLSPMSMLSTLDPPQIASVPFGRALRRLGVWPYRGFMQLAAWMAFRWEAPLHALRAELGLPRAEHPALFHGQFSPHLNLALFPRWLAQPAADWPARSLLTGFARYDGAPPSAELCARLDAYLDAGEPPLVFALGSSVALIAGQFWQEAIAAAQALGRRALLVTGEPWSTPLPPGIAAFEYLPYSRLFPRAAAVIHQAGIGTLAQALAAGRPQLIVPAAFDQPDNARRAQALGVARTLPIRKATAARLAHELAALLADAPLAARARQLAARHAGEDGAAVAAEALIAAC